MWHYKILTCQFYEWINFVLENVNISFTALELAQTPKLLGFLLYNVSNILQISCICGLSVMSALCHPMDCRPPGSSVHGISQARILERITISFYRGSSQPRNGICLSCIVKCTLPLSHLGSPHANTILFP